MAFVLIFGIQAVVFFVMGGLHDLVSVGIAFAIMLLCYGGGFGTMPSFNADYFGTKYLGINYGLIITAWGFAGLAGPLMAAFVKDRTGSFTGALVPVGDHAADRGDPALHHEEAGRISTCWWEQPKARA